MDSFVESTESNIFCLPDLGEGLPDAEIYEWFVKEGDTVTAFQPLISMETAKAVVDVPCPQSGLIIKLHGNPGDIIKTGAPLVEFAASDAQTSEIMHKLATCNTVVGQLEESNIIDTQQFTLNNLDVCRPKATPLVRLRAKQLGVKLQDIRPSGDYHVITLQDLEAHIENIKPEAITKHQHFEPLTGVRRSMFNSMTIANQNPVSVTVFDEADLHLCQPNTDITVRIIRALQEACSLEPSLNAWVDSTLCARKCMAEINVGLAMDHENQLFVPVIHNVAALTDTELRQKINEYKTLTQSRALTAQHLKNATITISNFGKFGGKFASPIIVPPTVAIIAIGCLYDGVVVEKDGKIAAHKLAPLSLSFDHRVITGGEATRFLSAMISALQRK